MTVLFCDLVDSTRLSQQLDPEDLRQVVRAYQETAAAVIQRFEGHIAQYLGDGLLVYFGYPRAHEDDAQRAVHTGLGIVEAMGTLNSRLQAEYGVALAVRLGLHTGPVVVGAMGGGGRHEHLALGETPNIAARLEGLAAPNTVVISAVTAQLVQRAFALEALGTQALKGITAPMGVWRVVGPLETLHEAATPAPEDVMKPLVGRGEELGLMVRRWEQSKAGQGQVVLISGEAGIGKSALVDTLRAHVRREGLTRVTVRCSPYHTNSALYPVMAHVQQVVRLARDDTAAEKLTKLEQALQPLSLPLHEVVPLMAALLAVPLPDGRYPPLHLTPLQQRQQTYDALVAWILEEAERQPVLMVWEDLHWADPSTLELLGLFIDQAPTAPLLHLLTFRPEFVPPWPPRSHMTPLTLHRLERPQVEAMIARLANGKTLPVEVIEHIVSKTDGVPLFIEELTKMLLESTLLREEADHYALTGPLAAVTIPTTLYDSLMARLDRLPTVREVAQLGAVLGREFSYELLHALMHDGGGHVATRSDPARGRRTPLSARPAAPRPLPLQACAHPGCRLRLPAEKHPAAVPPADCAAARSPVSRDRRRRARAPGTPLHRSRVPRAGRGLLAAGRHPGAPALRQCGSHRPCATRTRAAHHAPRHPAAHPARARLINHPGTGIAVDQGIRGPGSGPGLHARPRAVPTGR